MIETVTFLNSFGLVVGPRIIFSRAQLSSGFLRHIDRLSIGATAAENTRIRRTQCRETLIRAACRTHENLHDLRGLKPCFPLRDKRPEAHNRSGFKEAA